MWHRYAHLNASRDLSVDPDRAWEHDLTEVVAHLMEWVRSKY